MTDLSFWHRSAPGVITCGACGATWFCHLSPWLEGSHRCPACGEVELTWEPDRT